MLDCRRLEKSAVIRWKSFLFKGNIAVLSRSGRRAVMSCLFNEVVKHPQNRMFWISFSFSKIGSPMPTEGMTNLYEYIDVIEIKVFPDMWITFPDGGGKFQQDYFPCLSSKQVKTVFRKQKLNVFDWPGIPLDLNPTENSWSVTKCRSQKLHCTTMTKLIDARDDLIVFFYYPILSCCWKWQ